MPNKLSYILKDYTNLVILLLILTTFSGVLRKWMGFPTIINNIFLLILMLSPIYLLFIFKNKWTTNLNKSLIYLLHFFIGTLVILGVHPINLTYYHGIFGFFMHISFIAIILSYLRNKSDFNEEKIIKPFFIILIIQLIIGTIQYNSSPDSFINRYADNSQEQTSDNAKDNEIIQDIAKVGNATRVTGTFSYLGGYTSIVFFFSLFTFYLTKSYNSNYLLILAPIITYASLLSGSRGSLGFTLILLITFVLTERKLFYFKPKKTFFILSISCFAFFINWGLNDPLDIHYKTITALDNFISRVSLNKDESEGRLTNDLFQVFTRDFEYRNFGVGLGATYQGAIALFGSSEIVNNTPREGELFRIIMEGGIYFLLLRWLFLIIIFSFLSIPILLRITLFLFFCVFSQNVFHIYNAIYFSIGLIILNQAYIKKPIKIENSSF